MFRGELRAAVDAASSGGEFDRAFLADFQNQFRELPAKIVREAKGLIVQVNFHSHWHEGLHSAADLEVIINRPSVQDDGTGHVWIVRNRARTLLVQAKLGKNDERSALKWGRLKK